MSTQLRTPARGRRHLAGLLVLPLFLVVAGCSAAATPTAPVAPGTAAGRPSNEVAGATPGAPAVVPGGVTLGSAPSGGAIANPSTIVTSGGGIASSGVAVAPSGVGVGSAPSMAYSYPIYGGSPGVAPDNTIVVTGTGRSDVKADLADQASAQRSAIVAAIADARAQADVVARAAGVTITGVLSVSVSSGGAYAVPMAAGTAGATPGVVEGGAPNMAPVPVPGPIEPTPQQLFVSVTVAYRIS